MKRLFLSLTSLLFVGWLQAQTVQRVQWWFDADYSLCNTDSTTSTALWHLDIDASQLRDGFHTLYLHLQDTSGMWGSPRSFLFYKSPQVDSTGQANLVYTCWYDQDYSHHISGAITGGTMLIDASQLRDGFHTVNIQLGDGATARLKSFLFYKSPQVDSTGQANLVYTCWYDQDYSHHISGAITGGTMLIDASQLRDGFHTVNIQLGDGATARLKSFLFYKSPQVDSTGQANLVYTCWYDQDYSHHISGAITGGTMLIDASQLRDGFHTVNIQLGDGATARLKSYLIYKQLHLADDSSNIELVYWYDGEDQLTLRRSSPAVGLHLLDVPAMECGEQTINLALKDSRGNMTSLIKRDFILLDSACCLPPLFVTVDSITPQSAVVHWDYNREEPFTFTWDTQPFNPDSCSNIIHTTDTLVRMANLQEYTTYYYAVKSDCDSSIERWQTGSFRTEPLWHDRLYVATTGDGDGSSWQQASGTLQAALTRAESMRQFYGQAPDIWVAQGTYQGDGNDGGYAFTLVEGCNLYGGFAGNESALEQRTMHTGMPTLHTILDGRGTQGIMNQPTAFADSNRTVVDGFTFRNGRDNTGSGTTAAAAACLRGNVTVSNCTFENNRAATQQGAVYVYNSTIDRCRFTGNNGGNGIVAVTGTTLVTNCFFANNVAKKGGAIFANAAATGDDRMGAVINTTIVDNRATDQGGGVYFQQFGTQFINCILWNNTAGSDYNQYQGSARFRNCAIQGGFNDDSTCIALQPENMGNGDGLHYIAFSDPDNGDYHLTMTSAALNVGDNSVADLHDLDGRQRVWDSIVDVGCYELDYSLSCPPPSALQASVSADRQLTFSWQGVSPSYRVAWHTGLSDTLHYDTTSDTTITITGLPEATIYWQVQARCSDSDSSRYVAGTPAELLVPEEPMNDSLTYYVYNIAQLKWIADAVDSGNTMQGKTVRLMAALDLSGLNWNPIGDADHPFAGTFDGNDSVIYNLTVNRPTEDYVGLIARIAAGGQVGNLLIEGRTTLRGRNYVGSVAGYANDAVVTNCSNKIAVQGNLYVGGLLGWQTGGEMSSASSSGAVTSLSQCGGLIGHAEAATVRNVYSRGRVTSMNSVAGGLIGAIVSGSVTNGYSTNDITAPSSMGGGYGTNSGATFTNTYYKAGTCGNAGGSMSMAEVNMLNSSFVSLLNAGQQPEPWRSDYAMPTNDGYPILNWQRAQRYTVTYSQPQHATITVRNGNINVPSGSKVQQGSVLTVTVTPQHPYSVASIRANDTLMVNGGTFTVREETQIMAVIGLFLPELHVTSLTTSSMQAGEQATISWTVRNDGNGPTQAGEVWYDRVWLSTDSRVAAWDAGVTLLGEYQNVAALDSGEYYTNTVTVSIPQTLNGPFFLFVITDAYDAFGIAWDNGIPEIPYTPAPYISAVGTHCSGSNCMNSAGNRILELSEMEHGGAGCTWHDNFFYKQVNIQMPITADLMTNTVISPTTTFSGTPFNVTATISNNGDRATLVNRWSDVLYLCDTSVFFAGHSIRLAEVQHNGILDIDSQYTVQFTATVPDTMFGEYWLFVKTDYYNQVYEQVTTVNNNIRRSDNSLNVVLTPPADLSVTDIVLPDTVSTADNFVYSFQVTNNGAGSPNRNYWKDQVYLSTDSNTAAGNRISFSHTAHNGGLAPSGTYTVSQNNTLPSSIAEDDYWMYVVTDVNNNVFEYPNEGNNTCRSSHAVRVVKPDLQITTAAIPDTIVSGYQTGISFTLFNGGNGLINNRSIGYRLYMSANADGSNATTLATWSQCSTLQAGQSVNINCPNTIPDNLTEGTYYLFLQADVNNSIHESNETNNSYSANTVFVRHYPLPDLAIASFTMPDSVQRGSNVRVQFDIVNQGESDIVNAYCTFDVFVGDNTLCNNVRQLQPIATDRINLAVDDTLHFVRDIYIPNSVATGNALFYLQADRNNNIREGNESNNRRNANSQVGQAPLPDLEPIAFSIGNNLYAGSQVDVTFEVINRGNANVTNQSCSVKIYAVMAGSRTLCPVVSQTSPAAGNMTLFVNDVVQYSQTIRIPVTFATGRYSFELVVDEENRIAESNTSNNIFTVNRLIREYNFDLHITNCSSQPIATTGQTLALSWTVRNDGLFPNSQLPMMVRMNGEWQPVSGNTLPVSWLDKVYLSNDQTLSNDDVELLSVGHNTVLNPYGTYTVNQQCRLPNNVSGEKYLIFVTDRNAITLDNDRGNNQMVQPISIQEGLLPDLRIAEFADIDSVMIVGQQYTIRYRVVNDGQGPTTSGNWTDRFYLNNRYSLNNARLLTSRSHSGNLQPDSGYWDNVSFTIPEEWEGEFFLIGVTDASGVEYEGINENNNMLGVNLDVVQIQPCDLIVSQPTFAETVVPGDSITIGWTLRNIGSNAANGQIKEAVYLSTDTVWSSNDVMIAHSDANIVLNAGNSVGRSARGVVRGVAEGTYYVIVRTNIQTTIIELDYSNNNVTSFIPLTVDYPILTPNVAENTTIGNAQPVYYKLDVDSQLEGQTLSIAMTAPSNQVLNSLVVSHMDVPTMMSFDYYDFTPYQTTNEVLIPELEQGTYYIMAEGSTANSATQNVELVANIIGFEITRVGATVFSNSGISTTQILGSKFDKVMDFRIVIDSTSCLPAQSVNVVSSTQSLVSFDFWNVPAGTYDIEAELPGGIIARKESAIEVTHGSPGEFSAYLDAPSSVRRGNTFTMNLHYANVGGSNLDIIGLYIVCDGTNPMIVNGVMTREFAFYFPNRDGLLHPLAPGFRGTIPITGIALVRGFFSVKAYPIRRVK